MSDKEEYGIEDICTSLDSIERVLRQISDHLQNIDWKLRR